MGIQPANEDFALFYLELPVAGYLKDIEIQDEYDVTHPGKAGLSAQQVSAIARDSLEACKRDHEQAVKKVKKREK